MSQSVENFSELTRLSAGTVVLPEQTPYVAVVLGAHSGNVCTGTIIALDIVLTLARCFFNGTRKTETADSVRVLAGVASLAEIGLVRGNGSGSVQERAPDEITIHPNFLITEEDSSFGYNDLALLKLQEPFENTSYVNTIEVGEQIWTAKTRHRCSVAMFGVVDPVTATPVDQDLKMTEVTAMRPCTCNDGLVNHFGLRSLRWICIDSNKSGPTPCVGSAGAGLVCDDKLIAVAVGLIPFQDLSLCVFLHDNTLSCKDSNSLPVFLELCPYYRWFHLMYDDLDEGPQNCSWATVLWPSLYGFLLLVFSVCSLIYTTVCLN